MPLYPRDTSLSDAIAIRRERAVQYCGGEQKMIDKAVEKFIKLYGQPTSELLRKHGGWTALILESFGDAPPSRPNELGIETNIALIAHDWLKSQTQTIRLKIQGATV